MNTLPSGAAIAPHPTLSSARATISAATHAYALPVPTDARRTLARGWLWLALAALIGSGLFSVLLVLSRTPGLNKLFPVADFFRVALVVHVDLSVLVWFVALAGLIWSLHGTARRGAWGWAALGLCGAGAALMSLAPFLGSGEPIMANYIPVLDGAPFLAGLVVFGAGAALLVLHGLLTAPKIGLAFDGAGALHFGLNASVVAGAVALLAFAWSWAVLPASLAGRAYYEILFWGGGHALQFTWTLLMLVGWLWLAGACGARAPLSPRVALGLFALALVSVFVTPYAYLAHDIASVEHRNLHTWGMRFGGGLAIAPIALAVVLGLRGLAPLAPAQKPLRAALLASMLLFASGGMIGVFIAGSNVRIPAHYHGCIVGVTLALMGLVYHLLPRLGYRAPEGRLATLQPTLYGAGQLMHILGLVWSGGYGVQRKVAGAEQVLRSSSEIAGMGLMGLGGLIAIVGGLLFVVVTMRAMRQPAGEAQA
ncbi:MAG: cbb3-type cytochrome c oxidase subunit I [Piscinibacter sp.]|uniref:cbb3-type cytochrome c oxidase subunit I n=1 Tax=Piscinibacter sp. TaxID=1903157 RepID=UPI001B5544AF|nr:cbb3-type cytochrome c oxidase subunit I [Piscinibacter sp.]MBP5991689.1 cbb3-type cytochrome c oxidase subunit I [Piscinibacter sp.]MBP6029099.1 cbb3-type cytochrome c oxidase subunit I [Piscinibacter sp.]